MTSVLMPTPPPRPATPPATMSPTASSTTMTRRSTSTSNSMHIDLSGVPGLVQPSPPSNTLLITNLTNLDIFAPSSLAAIRAHIESLLASPAELHAFAPLKSLRRIIVSFTATEPAVALRRQLDGVALMGCTARLYFGEPTPIANPTTHLAAPVPDKQFFISPPPSPPHGWTMRNEDPPNKTVHADDLVAALARLDARRAADAMDVEPPLPAAAAAAAAADHHRNGDTDMPDAASPDRATAPIPRRKSSAVVFHPDHHGGSPGLPAVLVEDVSDDGAPQLETDRRILEHTARPPVELM